MKTWPDYARHGPFGGVSGGFSAPKRASGTNSNPVPIPVPAPGDNPKSVWSAYSVSLWIDAASGEVRKGERNGIETTKRAP